jgi:hypothetical protein
MMPKDCPELSVKLQQQTAQLAPLLLLQLLLELEAEAKLRVEANLRVRRLMVPELQLAAYARQRQQVMRAYPACQAIREAQPQR